MSAIHVDSIPLYDIRLRRRIAGRHDWRRRRLADDPFLILLFGIHPAAAVGTDLLHAAATKTAGSVVHGFNGSIDWRVVRRLAAGSVPMTVVTIAAMSALDINGAAGRNLVNAALTLALVATAVVLVFRGRIVTRYADRLGRSGAQQGCGADGRRRRRARDDRLHFVGRRGRDRRHGAASALPQTADRTIVGSDIAHAVPLTLVAGIGHWLLGSVDFQVFGR